MKELTCLQQKLADLHLACSIQYNEPMSHHTSFRIGGGAEVMAFPQTPEHLAEILHVAQICNANLFILGAGTNILAPDAGVSGIVICLKDALGGIEQTDETHIQVGAGVTMSRAAVFAANHNLSGLEFAHGIPGTIGGGVYMNAGAYGGEIRDVAQSVTVMDRNGNIRTLTNADMDFSYRHSMLETSGEIVICAVFSLQPEKSDKIREKMRQLQAKRSASQPLDMPSAGSAFKRPVGGYAAALIEQAGLKGFRVGQAAISAKHAGFAVNLGGATATDVKELLRQVSDTVYENAGIRLEPEIRIW